MTAFLRPRLLLSMAPVLTALLMGFFTAPAPVLAEEVKVEAHPQLNADGLHIQSWIKYPSMLDIPDAARKASAAGKSVMVLYEQLGCSYCQKMHTENFANPTLVNFLVKNFDVYQLDKNSDKPVIGPDGEKKTQAELYGESAITGTPTTLFYDKNAEEVFRLPGFLPTPHHYAALRYFVADSSKGNLSIMGFQAWVNNNADQVISELGG